MFDYINNVIFKLTRALSGRWCLCCRELTWVDFLFPVSAPTSCWTWRRDWRSTFAIASSSFSRWYFTKWAKLMFVNFFQIDKIFYYSLHIHKGWHNFLFQIWLEHMHVFHQNMLPSIPGRKSASEDWKFLVEIWIKAQKMIIMSIHKLEYYKLLSSTFWANLLREIIFTTKCVSRRTL